MTDPSKNHFFSLPALVNLTARSGGSGKGGAAGGDAPVTPTLLTRNHTEWITMNNQPKLSPTISAAFHGRQQRPPIVAAESLRHHMALLNSSVNNRRLTVRREEAVPPMKAMVAQAPIQLGGAAFSSAVPWSSTVVLPLQIQVIRPTVKIMPPPRNSRVHNCVGITRSFTSFLEENSSADEEEEEEDEMKENHKIDSPANKIAGAHHTQHNKEQKDAPSETGNEATVDDPVTADQQMHYSRKCRKWLQHMDSVGGARCLDDLFIFGF